ncbi:50S ribosomal protein L25/general stress protein Ctc [Tetragenococcus halophilus]|uniref:50S ribosomal protein L25/general stress protein Ctc n=1 Tax=Tetragenococcus halophilus TaxID=51669 RepID=UPI000CC3C2DF|nr:50S ribosomal protein L25/general stress protein Ctc [Tetragenococcus halophilus]MCF1602568.1 50S ribosomal protein L25/general stress protein Ctc [Tetragenococcus halophilus]MCO8285013.1 50S ribosomal protein L25/general stress protein Ctc [Tetragenococcus halophilus]MCT8310518.1 50S ribosomal protein L25/general stress protein Ctc [Tetragenococcus halophilus]GBD66159.1 50S ribosomal protein L25 [Tetragenococcus halophilus subsp. halophilus]GBD77655.1 50S ribosomal protein L25 [Tetragenoco
MAVALEVEKRAVRPRSIRNKLRHEGRVPAIVNGYQIESTPISVNAQELDRVLRENGLNSVITMNIDGKKVNTLVQDYSADTFTQDLIHVEFLSVNMTEEQEVEAEINLVGEASGVKAGGVLTQTLYSANVSATPDKLPENIEVDISNLEIGDSINISDIPVAKDYTIVNDPEEQIASINEPEIEEEPEEETEEAEPEVIGESDEDSEE